MAGQLQDMEKRWPDAWNPRPVADFQFNGDGILLYPGPDATLLSSVRQESSRTASRTTTTSACCATRPRSCAASRRIRRRCNEALTATEVPAELSASLTEFTHDPAGC